MNDHCKVKILVGEPWDFESPDGQNIILGEIVARRSDKELIFRSNHRIIKGNRSGRLLLLEARYVDIPLYDNGIYSSTCSGSLIENEFDSSLFDNEQTSIPSDVILIGELQEIND